jgi:sulfatase maturation enzyme AslB (radical SAM superfamily)
VITVRISTIANNRRPRVPASNYGFCSKCRATVPAHVDVRDERVVFVKQCPSCGPTESLISRDVAAWQHKRDVWDFNPADAEACRMQCHQCGISHEPTIVFVDVTNRCNMNCPICIANIRGMGFEFHPPLDYFDNIFRVLGTLDPVPMVQLFGGEPTVRDDLLDIINLARKYGVKTRIVTNGLKLANEEYCKTLCGSGARFRLALDGRSPEIYRRLRKNPGVYEKKIKALENIKRYSRRKHAILCCAARNINDRAVGDLIDCCHEYADVIDSLGLLPLAENVESDVFDDALATTREDAERMVAEGVPGGDVEFIPAGILQSLRTARRFLKPRSASDALMFGGVHPDCETMTLLASDGQRYRSINHFLKRPLGWVAHEIRARAQCIEPALKHLDPHKTFDRLRARLIIYRAFVPLAAKAVHLGRVFRGNPLLVTARLLAGLLTGRRPADLARKHFNLSRLLRVAILPFEEFHAIDASRLRSCKAVFAYQNAHTGAVETIPACVWGSVYRNDVLRDIANKYNRGRSESPRDDTAKPAAHTPHATDHTLRLTDPEPQRG